MLYAFSSKPSQIGWLLRGRLIFVSYRTQDSFDITGRLCDHLVHAYGRSRVIRDIDSIPIGCDFLAYIEDAIAHSRAFVAVIGPDWCGDRASGKRHLDNCGDVLRFELLCARRWGIPIYPVLVNRARLPSEASLPDDLKFVAGLQAMRLRGDIDFHADFDRLRRGIEKGKPVRKGRKAAAQRRPPSITAAAAADACHQA